MRMILAVLWGLWLLICTCTVSVEQLIHHFQVKFMFNQHPDWSQLLVLNKDFEDKTYLLQKAGHFSGFFILTLILSIGARTKGGLYFAICFAVFTEIAQLFFNRDGRIFDMLIDSAGILCAYGITKGLSAK